MELNTKNILQKFASDVKHLVEVELSIGQDIKKEHFELDKLMREINSIFKELSGKVGKARTLSSKINKDARKAQQMLDDLGVKNDDFKAFIAYTNNATKALQDYKTPNLF